MPYYNTCPHCGAHLDPGERCDCQRELATDYPPKISLYERSTTSWNSKATAQA